MNTLIVIEEDERIQRDIKLYLSDFKEEVEVDYFKSVSSFKSKYLLSKEEQETQSSSENSRKGYLKNIGIVCISLDMVPSNLKEWMEDVRKRVKDNLLRPDEFDTKFVLLAHEEGEVKLDGYCLEPIEDIIYKPLDRQFFQQKMEIILHLPKNTSPSFLVNQKSEDTVEMGKQSRVAEISEFGICITNPRLLSDGQFASFYSTLFDESDYASVLGKSYKSFENPNQKGSFNCYFNFFGITKSQLNSVRRKVRGKNARDKSPFNSAIHGRLEKLTQETINLAPAGDPRKSMKVGDLALVDEATIQLEKKYFVIIDMAKEVQDGIKGLISENFRKAEVIVYPTLAHFNLDFFDEIADTSNVDTEDEEGTEDSEEEKVRQPAFPGESLLLAIDKTDKKLISLNPKLEKDQLFLGYSGDDFKNDPELWKKLVHKKDRSFDEFFKYVSSGQNGTLSIWFQDKHGFDFFLEVKGSASNDRVTLELKDVTDEKGAVGPEGANKGGQKIPRVDGIFIDVSMLSQPYSQWAKAFRKNLKDVGLIKKRKDLKVYLLGMEDKGKRPKEFGHPGYDGFFFKPLERSFMLQSLMVNSYPGLLKSSTSELSYFSNVQSIILTTTVKMSEISEFGIAIKYPAFIRPGVFIRFVNEILRLEDGTPIVGRCYFSEAEPDEEGLYSCYFLYFGVTDTVFKKIRLWIREKYIEGKSTK